jgi:hypothetical protein
VFRWNPATTSRLGRLSPIAYEKEADGLHALGQIPGQASSA